MDVVLTAGGKAAPDDLLYPVIGDTYKAMMDICGKPMIQWVLDALNGSTNVGRIVVMGLPQDCHLESRLPLELLGDFGSMLANISTGADYLIKVNPAESHCLVVSSDVPALKPYMVDWLVEQAVAHPGVDGIYNVIERPVMEKTFPASRRTYLPLKCGEYCGGDVNVLRKSMVAGYNPSWQKIVDARKNPLRQAQLVGVDILLSLLLRTVTVEQLADKISERMGFVAIPMHCPFPELGMDVDKPFQRDIISAHLSLEMA